jgi:hypothetical protein
MEVAQFVVASANSMPPTWAFQSGIGRRLPLGRRRRD